VTRNQLGCHMRQTLDAYLELKGMRRPASDRL